MSERTLHPSLKLEIIAKVANKGVKSDLKHSLWKKHHLRKALINITNVAKKDGYA